MKSLACCSELNAILRTGSSATCAGWCIKNRTDGFVTVHIVREDEDRRCWTQSCGFKRRTQLVKRNGIESVRHWCGELLVM